MLPILDSAAWRDKVRQIARPGANHILAFYEHRVGAICCDAKEMLVPLDDHLVHRGDGVFETIRISEGKIFNLSAHLERLRHSAQGLRLNAPCPWEDLRGIVLDTARAAGTKEGSIRILLGRGPGGFDIDPAECPCPSLYVIVYGGAEHTEEWYAKGLAACRSHIPVRPSMLAHIKSNNYLPGVLMTLEAERAGADIAFSFDENGCLAEAATANVAIVDSSGTLAIPEFRNALPGTTVRKAAELAAPFMPVATRAIPEKELFEAREILVLGTAHECVGAVSYEGKKIGSGRPGQTALRLRRLIREDLLAGGTSFLD